MRIVSLLGFLVTLSLLSAQGAVIHVPADQATIQAGINVAGSGDTVFVAPGEYFENLAIINKCLTLQSDSGPNSTMLQPLSASSIVTTYGESPDFNVISGFTFAGGVDDIPTVFIADSARILIQHCIFKSNCPTQNSGQPIIMITGQKTTATIKRNLFYNNGGLACVGIQVTPDSRVVVINNTFDSNARGIYCLSTIGTTANGNIISNSDQYGVYGHFDVQDYNDCFNNGGGNWVLPAVAGGHCLSSDPLFTDQTSHEYTLQSNSPCIDAGDPNPQLNDSNGSSSDIGAFPSPYFRRQRPAIHVPSQSASIQSAIDQAIPGDTIVVGPGVYIENLDFKGKSICLLSAEGAEQTILHPADSTKSIIKIAGFTVEPTGIHGFSISEGGSTVPTVLISSGARATISNNLFYDNLRGSTEVATVIRLEGTGSGGVISRNLFFDNGGINCITVASVGRSMISNNTFYGNHAGMADPAYLGADSALNNIFVGNTNYGIWGANAVQLYNNSWNNGENWSGYASQNATDLSVDPAFVDAPAHDFRLLTTSPCIDSGAPENVYDDPDGTRGDMGAIATPQSNVSPKFQPIGAIAVPLSSSMQLHLISIDDNGTTPQLSALDLPTGAVVADSGNGHGAFFWTPSISQVGQHVVQFIASDGSRGDTSEVRIGVDDFGEPLELSAISVNQSNRFAGVIAPLQSIQWQLSPLSLSNQVRYQLLIAESAGFELNNIWYSGITLSSDTTVVYTGPPLQMGHYYRLQLRLGDAQTWCSRQNTWFRINTPPPAPIVGFPNNGVVVTESQAICVGERVEDPDRDTATFEVELFADSLLLDVVGRGDHLKVPWTIGFQIFQWKTPILAENTSYWWRARAFDSYEYSPWSVVQKFYVDSVNTAPTAPSLLPGPDIGGGPVYTVLPSFLWTSSNDPDPLDFPKYRLQLAANPTFLGAATYEPLTDTTFTPPNPLHYGARYYWRVGAVDHLNSVSYSSPYKVFWIWTLGDIDRSNNTDIADLSRLIDYLYISFNPISPAKVADIDGDCVVDIADLSRLIDYLYISLLPLTQAGCAP